MNHETFIKKAIDLALTNVTAKKGGPFGAVVVKDGKIIGMGQNSVTSQNDPTAHAEVMAIRDACKTLQDFQLKDCIIYSSCEPCPMCLSAIYWARPKAVYFACTKEDAANIQFDDQFIYEQISQPLHKRTIPMNLIQPEGYMNPFTEWCSSIQKISY